MRLRKRALLAALIPFAPIDGMAQNGPQTPAATETITPEQTDQSARNLPDLVDGKRTFLPSYFAINRPQTARDMVGNVPGFGIQDGGDARGFGANAGNVLIDGNRPTTKSDDLDTILANIPARAVLRVELLEGAAASALVTGQNLVVNVVRDPNSISSGQVELTLRGGTDGLMQPNGRVSYTTNLAGFRVTGAAESGRGQAQNLLGYEGLMTPSGQWIEQGPNWDQRISEYARMSLQAERDFGQTHFSGNGRYGRSHSDRAWTFDTIRTGQTAPYRYDDGGEFSHHHEWELSSDFSRNVQGWNMRLALLDKFQHDDEIDIAGTTPTGSTGSYGRFSYTRDYQEQIARLTGQRSFGAHAIETGGEYALTSSDMNTNYSEGDGRTYVTIPGTISNTRVQESRWEAFIADNWTITPKWSVEANMTGEWSNIGQSGDANKERSFFYPKPRLHLIYKPDARRSFRLEAERSVGQLDFGAFADSADVSNGSQNTGNPELRPYRLDTLGAAFQQRWGERGVFDLRFIDQQFHDLLTLVPLTNGNTATGNIAEGHQWGFDVVITVPLPAMGQQTEWSMQYSWRDSNMIDPFTQRARRFDYSDGIQFTSNFSHQFPNRKTSVGAWIWVGDHSTQYQPSQFYEWSRNREIGFWLAQDLGENMSLEAGTEMPFDGNHFERHRYDYSPDRATGTISAIHYRERNVRPRFYITLKRTI